MRYEKLLAQNMKNHVARNEKPSGTRYPELRYEKLMAQNMKNLLARNEKPSGTR
jgi:hypothetical protein